MIKEIDEKTIKEELAVTQKRIAEIENKELKELRKKSAKLQDILKNSIRCPKCKKLFKEVYVSKEFISTNYSKGGYFGDEIHSINAVYVTLECPACNWHWDKYLRTWQGYESSNCDMKYKETLKCEYVLKKVKMNSSGEIIKPKKGSYFKKLGPAF